MAKKEKEKIEEGAEPERAKPAAAAAAAADTILESMIDGVDVVDAEGRIIQANNALTKMLGYKSPDELIGKTILDIISKKDIPRTMERFQEYIRNKEKTLTNLEITFLRKDGSEFPVMLNITTLLDEKGEYVGGIAIIRDITELKRLQEKEKEVVTAKMATNTIDAMGDALILANMDGKIVSINPAFEKLTGYDKSELIEKEAVEFLPKWFKGEDMENMMNVFGTALEGKVPASSLVSIITTGGEVVSATFTVSFIKDAEGKPTHIVATIKDITELKKKTDELEERYKELEKFSDAAVDRELKMVELKKEIENLKQRLGEG